FTFSNSCHDLLRASLASIPNRPRKTISVYGFTTPVGFAPALYDSNRPPPSLRRKYSAKMLRAELPVHRKRTRNGWSPCCMGLLLQKPGLLRADMRDNDLGSYLGKRGREPTKEHRRRRGAHELRDSEACCVFWSDAGESVGGRSRHRYGRIGERR